MSDDRTDGSRRGRRAVALLHVALIVAASLAVTRTVSYVRNTLHRNGSWSSGKVSLERGVMGAVGTLVTRVALQRERLDLGAYFGYQQFLLDEGRPVESLGFTLDAGDRGYVDVLFGPSDDRLSGIRLSFNDDYRSLSYRVTADGEFLDPAPFEIPAVTQPVRVSMDFGTEAVALSFAGHEEQRLGSGPGEVRVVGFRGGERAMLVDDVEVAFRDGGRRFVETFAHRRGRLAVLLTSLAGFSLLSWIAVTILIRSRGMPHTIAHFTVCTAWVVVTASVLAYHGVDWYRLSGRYPQNPRRVDFKDYENRIATEQEALARLDEIRDSLADDPRERILLIGGSQTWGSGASRHEDALDRVLERELEAAGACAPGCVVINAGIPGLKAADLLQHYRRSWVEMEPDLVVLNVGTNDRADATFLDAVEGFVESNRARRIRTLLVLEPNSPEIPGAIERRHALLRSVAQKHDLPFVEMHVYLRSRAEDGFLWWDSAHLTSYGQRLFGEHLAGEIVRRGRDRARL